MIQQLRNPIASPKRWLWLLVPSIAIGLVLMPAMQMNFITAQASEDLTTISGRVVNGTDGGETPSQFTVFALVIDETAEAIVERVETTTDDDGTFSLDVESIGEGRFYRVVVDDGVYTPYVDLIAGNATDDLTLTVYERTAALDDISVTTYSMVIPIIDASEGVIGVLSAVNMVNSGDKVYLADLTDPDLTGFNLLRFNLPIGFQELTVESDLPSGNVMEINTGFAISNPVPPGEYSMVISYSVPFEGGKLEYPMRLPFGAESVTILLPVNSGELTGLGLTRGEVVNIGDGRYIQYQGSNYERRAELNVIISGLPRPDLQGQLLDFFSSVQFRIALIISVALAMVAIVLYVVLATRRRARVAIAGGSNTDDGSATTGDRSEILEAIARLDELHDLGKIAEDEYLEQRRQLFQQAIEIDREDGT